MRAPSPTSAAQSVLSVVANQPILAFTGLAKEANLVAGPGVVTITARAGLARLARDIECRAVISFGIAGGLDPTLVAGDVVVASSVIGPMRTWPVDGATAQRLLNALGGGLRRVIHADLVGVDEVLKSPLDKDMMRRKTGAAAVDMESHRAAAFAAERRLPFASLRVVCDPADRSLPLLASSALSATGKVNVLAVIAGLLRNPRELSAMIRIAKDAHSAFVALESCHQLLGPDLGAYGS